MEEKAYTSRQIERGLRLAQQHYEGWQLDELDPEQLLEAIENALEAEV